MKNRAYIIGNGNSRKNFDLSLIRENDSHCPIIGCNALYREFDPDFLIALDSGIIDEISESHFSSEKLIVPDFENQFEPAEFNPNRPRENAGMVAMKEAINMGATHLICLGFDFLINDINDALSNVFENTNNYGPNTRSNEQDILNRCRYFDWFATNHYDIVFHMVFSKEIQNFQTLRSKNIFGLWYENIFDFTKE